MINITPPIGRPLWEIHPTSGTSNPEFWNSQKLKCETQKSTEKNTGGAKNTELTKASESATIQKTTESGPAPHQSTEEALSHQARETSTRSWNLPRN